MEGSKSLRKYSNYLVKKDIQLRSILYNVIFLLIVALITLVTALAPMWQKITQSHAIEVQFYAASMLLNFLKLWIPVMSVVFIIFIVHQIVLTHRVCGPLINFMHTIRAVAAGNLTRNSHIRKADYLGDECNEINQMVDGLTDLLSETQLEGEHLFIRFESIQPSQATQEELENTLHVAKEKVDTFKKALANFKVEKIRTDHRASN